MNNQILVEIAFLFYGLANFSFLGKLATQKKGFETTGLLLAALGVLAHLSALTMKGFALKRCPILNVYDALGLASIIILTGYFYIQWKWLISGLGFLATFLAFFFTLISLSSNRLQMSRQLAFTGTVLEVHIGAVILSFAILALAFCFSVAYLVQDFMLHGKRLAAFSKRLPPLSTLDFLTNRLVVFGFMLLSVSIIFGSIWSERVWGVWLSLEPKLVLALITWLIYATYIYLRSLSGWKGRRSNLLIIIGFILIVVTFLHSA